MRAEGNLAAGLLDQAAGSVDVNLLEPLNERFVAAKEHIEKMLQELPPSLDDGQIQKAASTLIDLGKGNDGIFALRRAELQQIAVAQSALEGSRALAVQLGDEVTGLVTAARAATNAAASPVGPGHQQRQGLHDDHYGCEYRRRRDRHAVLRRAMDHSASGKHYRSDDGSCSRRHVG